MNRAQLQETADKIESAVGCAFPRIYLRRDHDTYGKRRNWIGAVLWGHFKVSVCVEDRDQLRRYFDAKWGATQVEDNKYAHIPSVWDEIKDQPTPVRFTTPTKEPVMATSTKPIEITVATFANGEDISKMSNSEVFSLIAAQEAEIEALKKIKAQPKKLVAEIAKRQAGIDALVAHLNSKEA